MAISLLHTPEGVRDLYNEECAKKETVSAKIGAVFHRFGYRSIQTPSYEFFDIFNKDRGSVASNQMFKFFDRDGNTLVLRPDITPSIQDVRQNISWMRTCQCVFVIMETFSSTT